MPDYVLSQISTSPYWYITWTEGRRSRRASTRTADRKQAEEILAAFRLEYNPDAPEILTTSQVLDWYNETHAKDLLRADLAQASIDNLKAFFGTTPAAEIDPQKQSEYVERRRRGKGTKRTKPLANDSINRELSVLSAALRKAYEWKLIAQPFKVQLLPKAEAKERYLTRSEVAKLYAYLRKPRADHKRYDHILLFTRIALNTGARPGAILSLTWDRVDFARRTIWFPVPGKRQTNKRAAVISFDHKLEASLRRFKASRDDRIAKLREIDSPLADTFTDHVIEFEGAPVKVIRKSIVKACLACGIRDVTPHTFRHTFATWGAMGGAPLYVLGGALGHSNPSTTARYAKYQPEAFKDVIRATRKKMRA